MGHESSKGRVPAGLAATWDTKHLPLVIENGRFRPRYWPLFGLEAKLDVVEQPASYVGVPLSILVEKSRFSSLDCMENLDLLAFLLWAAGADLSVMRKWYGYDMLPAVRRGLVASRDLRTQVSTYCREVEKPKFLYDVGGSSLLAVLDVIRKSHLRSKMSTSWARKFAYDPAFGPKFHSWLSSGVSYPGRVDPEAHLVWEK